MTDERDDVIVLKDENGQEIEFEYLDTVERNGKEYIVLLPLEEVEEEEEGEVVILQVKEVDGEEEFLPVEDEGDLNAVFEIFKERMKDEFEFADDEDEDDVDDEEDDEDEK